MQSWRTAKRSYSIRNWTSRQGGVNTCILVSWSNIILGRLLAHISLVTSSCVVVANGDGVIVDDTDERGEVGWVDGAGGGDEARLSTAGGGDETGACKAGGVDEPEDEGESDTK